LAAAISFFAGLKSSGSTISEQAIKYFSITAFIVFSLLFMLLLAVAGLCSPDR
jgi:hypothetical protein